MKKRKCVLVGKEAKRICTRNEFNQISRHCKQSFDLDTRRDRSSNLKDITLTLEPGHIYGIIGPNGAGKSSFLRHVLAFLKTESKESMKIGDVPAADYSRKSLQGCYPLCRRKQILRQTLRQRRSL